MSLLDVTAFFQGAVESHLSFSQVAFSRDTATCFTENLGHFPDNVTHELFQDEGTIEKTVSLRMNYFMEFLKGIQGLHGFTLSAEIHVTEFLRDLPDIIKNQAVFEDLVAYDTGLERDEWSKGMSEMIESMSKLPSVPRTQQILSIRNMLRDASSLPLVGDVDDVGTSFLFRGIEGPYVLRVDGSCLSHL